MHFKLNVDVDVPTEDLVQVVKALTLGDTNPLQKMAEKLASDALRGDNKGSVDPSSVFDNVTRNLGETFSDQSGGGASLPKIIDALVGSVRPDLKDQVAPQVEAMSGIFQGLSGMFMEMMNVKKEESGDPDVILAAYDENEHGPHHETEVRFVELSSIESVEGKEKK